MGGVIDLAYPGAPGPGERRKQLAAAARQRWPELRAEDLRQRPPYVVGPDGQLFRGVVGAVLDGGANSHRSPFHAAEADAFYVDSTSEDLVFLRDAGLTLAELEQQEDEAEQLRAQAQAERRAFITAQPQRDVTLADVLGEPLPTLREAVQQIEDVFGQISEEGGRLRIAIPERIGGPSWAEAIGEQDQRVKIYRAARVVYAAEVVVLDALRAKGRQALSERVPDAQVTPSGGLAR